MSYDLAKFKHGLEELRITLTDHQIEQFLQYYEMLVEKNKVMNLTGITEYEEVIQKHFLDSLSLIRVIPTLAEVVKKSVDKCRTHAVTTAVCLYGICALLSAICSPYGSIAWNGEREWYMGAVMICLMIGGFLLTAKYGGSCKTAIWLGEAAFVAVTLIGLLQKLGYDPLGLLKGYGWLNPDTLTIDYNTNGMPDYTADQMYTSAKENGTEYGGMDTMPDIVGLGLWKQGHWGVYVGNGYAIEAMGTQYGVVRTQVEGRGWQGWCKIPYIQYDE